MRWNAENQSLLSVPGHALVPRYASETERAQEDVRRAQVHAAHLRTGLGRPELQAPDLADFSKFGNLS